MNESTSTRPDTEEATTKPDPMACPNWLNPIGLIHDDRIAESRTIVAKALAIADDITELAGLVYSPTWRDDSEPLPDDVFEVVGNLNGTRPAHNLVSFMANLLGISIEYGFSEDSDEAVAKARHEVQEAIFVAERFMDATEPES